DRREARERPWTWWACRLTHPLPILSLVVLLVGARRRPLAAATWLVLAACLVYLAPYVAVGYYDRYGFPLVGLKALLIVWAGAAVVRLVGKAAAGDKGRRAEPSGPPPR